MRVAPRSVTVLGARYRVALEPLQDECGDYDPIGLIRIDSSQSAQMQARTLLHEMAHALWAATRDDDAELDCESFARMFETGAADLIERNWQVVEWVRASGGAPD